MDCPLVTVIVPAFNAEQYLETTLQSIKNQTYPNLEIIVVDDGSTDNTAAIIKSHSPSVTYVHQENSGSCAAPRNTGIKIARGQFVTFFDADDLMSPDKITTQIQDLADFPQAKMSICNYQNFTSVKKAPDHFSSCPQVSRLFQEEQNTRLLLPSQRCRALFIDENFGSACSPLFRISAIERTGGFDETLRACEDFHLNYRVAQSGDVVINAFIGFERRLHNLNMSSDSERMLRNLISSRCKLIASEPNTELQSRLADRVQRYRRDLQTCLVKKNRLSDAVKLYLQTFPPKSFSDINHDFRQGLKILWQYAHNGRAQESTH